MYVVRVYLYKFLIMGRIIIQRMSSGINNYQQNFNRYKCKCGYLKSNFNRKCSFKILVIFLVDI